MPDRAFAAAGTRIDAIYACAHHPAGDPPYAHPNHPARKPNPGDKAIDIEAARGRACRRGYGRRQLCGGLCRSIADAPRLIPLLAERKHQPNRPRERSPARRSRCR